MWEYLHHCSTNSSVLLALRRFVSPGFDEILLSTNFDRHAPHLVLSRYTFLSFFLAACSAADHLVHLNADLFILLRFKCNQDLLHFMICRIDFRVKDVEPLFMFRVSISFLQFLVISFKKMRS